VCVSGMAGKAGHIVEVFAIPPVHTVTKIFSQGNKKRKQNNDKDIFFPPLSLSINSRQKALSIFYLFMIRNPWHSLQILKLLVATAYWAGFFVFIWRSLIVEWIDLNKKAVNHDLNSKF